MEGWLIFIGIATVVGIVSASIIAIKRRRLSQQRNYRRIEARQFQQIPNQLILQQPAILDDRMIWTDINISSQPPNIDNYPLLDDRIVWEDIDFSPQENQNGHQVNYNGELQEIIWADRQPNLNRQRQPIDDSFLDPNAPQDINNLLRQAIGTRDHLTQEIFRPGDRIYRCRVHGLAYHEDSWQEQQSCPVCGHPAQVEVHILPTD